MNAVQAFRWAERLAVTGEALTQRLLGRRQLVESLLQSCINDTRSSLTANIPEGQHISSIFSQQQPQTLQGTTERQSLHM